MSDVRDAIARSIMKPAQQRRIGALQSAKAILYGTGYQTPVVSVDDLLTVAKYVEGNDG